jgi:hypothetical protein
MQGARRQDVHACGRVALRRQGNFPSFFSVLFFHLY